MMQLLQVGGIPLLCDGVRTADEDNPRGYYEFEPTKRTREDPAWVKAAVGKAVKVVYKFLYDLPAGFQYRVLFMRRDLQEVLASQRIMLNRRGVKEGTPDAVMADLFRKELAAVERWLAAQENFAVLYLDYSRIIQAPRDELMKVVHFLGPLDLSAMCTAVEPSLYRNRTAVDPNS